MLTRTKTKLWRLAVSSLVGALVAVAYVLSPEALILKLGIAFLGIIPIVAIICGKTTLRRAVRMAIAFMIFSALLGAGVNFIWGIFDGIIRDSLVEYSGSGVNRKLLLIAIAVLISIGVFKMIVAVFSGTVGTGQAEIKINYENREVSASALVDSGNLALDPTDMQPILFIKEEIAVRLFLQPFWHFIDPDTLDPKVRRRIRLIPISQGGRTRVLMGIKVDSVKVISADCEEEISVTVAIDKEGGTFGGFSALIPATALCNAGK